MRYDPSLAPDPAAWLAASEDDRLDAVRRHHKRAKIRIPGAETHAAIHAAVETQLAEGHPDATTAMRRLMGEGLDRHEALHAIGSVLAEELFGVIRSGREYDPGRYSRELADLTAASWRAKYGE